MKELLLACVSFILVGCATTGAGVVENSQGPKDGRGIALFSTSANSTSLSFAVALTLVNGESLKKYDKVIIQINSKFQKSSFPNVHSTVRTLELPAGTYCLMGSEINPYFATSQSPIYKFEVISGQVQYIGNIYFTGTSLNWSLDYKDRDIDFFRSKNPGLGRKQIGTQDIRTDLQYQDFRKGIKGIIWGVP